MTLTADAVNGGAMAPDALRGRNILVFCDYYGPNSNGGAERVAREVNARLVQAGASVTVITAVDGEPHRENGVRVLPLRAIDLSAIIGAQLSVARGSMRTARRAMRILQPDVLYAHSLHFHGTITAARLRSHGEAPLVTVAHVAGMEHVKGLTRIAAEAHERTVARWILRRSDSVVAVSDSARAHCIDRGAPPERVSVARNGVDHGRFVATVEPSHDVPLILYVGRLIADKGPQNLLAACELLRRQDVPFRLVFVGDGPMRQRLTVEAARLGIAAELPGRSRNVARWMRDANVVVLPSYKEGAPLVVTEAMASQRCVLASALPPTRELITHGVDGMLHAPGDVEQLAAQLRRVLLDDPYRYRVAASAARRSADLTWDATARGHVRALAGAIGMAHT